MTDHDFAGDVRLRYTSAGQGPPVVLLHGFPERRFSWRHQIAALAEAGFRAVAPDLRGYGDSERPAGVAAYRVARLIGDLSGLLERETGSAFVVGHDWGGVLAWRLAQLRPDLVRRLAILNAPHPASFRRELASNPVQWLRSWYILLFQLPWLPERVLRAGDFALMRRAWAGRRGAPDVADLERAFREPGALTGPLNYYRAMTRYRGDLNGSPQEVKPPTLVIWGERDPYLGLGLSEGLGRWVKDLRVERIPDAGHRVQHDAAGRVNDLLVRFFREA